MFSFTRAVPKSQLRFTVRNSLRTYVSIGDKVPATPVFEGSPGNDINLAEETASGKTILIGVPGAFSPACSASHVPGYIKIFVPSMTKATKDSLSLLLMTHS